MTDDSQRLTVSRDALRADLAEMELRLRSYFDDQMRTRARATDLVALAAKVDQLDRARVDLPALAVRVDQLDRGDFTAVHQRALNDYIDERLSSRSATAWTWKSRGLTIISVGSGVCVIVLMFIQLKGGAG